MTPVVAYDVRAAADAVHMSRDVIQRAISKGELVAYRPPGVKQKWLIRPDDLDAWVRKGEKS